MIITHDSHALPQVKKIVQGSFGSFQAMYKPFLDEFAAEGLLEISLSGGCQAAIKQVSSKLYGLFELG